MQAEQQRYARDATSKDSLINDFLLTLNEIEANLAEIRTREKFISEKTEKGNELSNTPQNSFSLWAVHDLPKGFQVGLGTQYVDSRYNNSNEESRQQAPSFTLVNGLVGYQLNENVAFRLNGYNLFDKEYIDQVGGGHFVPGAGRSVVLTADIKF